MTEHAELERRLADLARAVDWPETPELALRLAPAPPPRRRRALVVALAALALAVAVAFAVPPARSAILRFLHLGGVTVERVDTLPEAVERPLASGLGLPVTVEEAEDALGGPVALLRLGESPQLYLQNGVVSAVLATPGPVLVSEFRHGEVGTLLKKVATPLATVEVVRVDDLREGLWIAGEQHVVFWLEAPPRLAGNVFVWEYGGITYRIEGKRLTKERALELARGMSG